MRAKHRIARSSFGVAVVRPNLRWRLCVATVAKLCASLFSSGAPVDMCARSFRSDLVTVTVICSTYHQS